MILWQSLQLLYVYCDMDTDGGGWTVFQNRFDGSVDFYRNSAEYERGFGNLEKEFWLGLAFVQEMTSQGKTELRVDLTAADGTTAYDTFQNFYLSEGPNYSLHFEAGTYTGWKSMLYHNGVPFTTYDADRDAYDENCTVKDRGGWWYSQCADANLNGEFVTPGTERSGRPEAGMVYKSFKGTESLKASKMMSRRVSRQD
ncbi:ficolin-3-like [Mercenaria mercenaria]|uniref:ficolin-3-like n=1 Tax=Mercenaria mercenaria TaxID=6596 RepID=UPI00234F9B9C|nr:ficolin-3-like [Mercenaria mercenaria]